MRLKTFSYLIPTTHTNPDGKFHPAVRFVPTQTYYWPNITFDNEMEAYIHAEKSVADAIDAANVVIENWNLVTP